MQVDGKKPKGEKIGMKLTIDDTKREREKGGSGDNMVWFVIQLLVASLLWKKKKKKTNDVLRADGERVNCHSCEKFSASERKGEQPCFSTLITSNSSLGS